MRLVIGMMSAIVCFSLPSGCKHRSMKEIRDIPNRQTLPSRSESATDSGLNGQWFVEAADGSRSCLEAGSTQSGASLLGLACVSSKPLRQQFKLESLSGPTLLLDQRTQMCVQLSSSTPARVMLGPCRRNGELSELWTVKSRSSGSGSFFQLQSARSGNCLALAEDKKIVQANCEGATPWQRLPVEN